MLDRLHSFADSLVLLHGWRRALVATLAGAGSVLALPPFFLLPVLLVTLPILVLLLDGADADPSARQLGKKWQLGSFFKTGWCFGFGFFLAGLYWIGEALTVNASAHAWLIPFALTLIPAGLALFIALACSLAGFFWTNGFARLAILACFLVAFEWLRGLVFTGFTWNSFHTALAAHDVLIQGFALAGPWMASLLVLLVAMAPAALWPHGQAGRFSKPLVAACALAFLAWTGFGTARLMLAIEPSPDAAMVRIVQPNIAQGDKWNPDLREQHVATLLDLTSRQTGPGQLGVLGSTLVIWPESAFPFLLTQRPDVLGAIGQVLPLGSTLVAGAIRSEARSTSQVFYNSIYALNERGEIADAYDKALLVPFGEQLPFSDLFDRLGLRPLVSAPVGFAPGPGPGALALSANVQALALVCYEAIFPAFVRQGALETGATAIVNVTNDAWFGTSAGPHQHFHQARLRSVELGLPLIRAANTGISAVVDGYGRTQARLAIGVQGVLDAPLPTALPGTLYKRWGDGPFAITLVLVLILSVYHSRMKRLRRS